MQRVSETKAYLNIVNNVSKEISNNDSNVNSFKKRYMLDKTKFTPNTEETRLAEDIATKLDDLGNYAAFLGAVNKNGCLKIRRLLASVLDDIETKKKTKNPVRKPGAYFMWKLKREMY